MENAAPAARRDLEKLFERLVPEDAPYEHDDEGADDSTSHISMLRSDYHRMRTFEAAIRQGR